MINIAVYLKSESCDNYLYLYSVEKPEEVVSKLLSDNYEFETGCICDYEVESNCKEINKQVIELISEHLDNDFDNLGEED